MGSDPRTPQKSLLPLLRRTGRLGIHPHARRGRHVGPGRGRQAAEAQGVEAVDGPEEQPVRHGQAHQGAQRGPARPRKAQVHVPYPRRVNQDN
nr:MAG TPA: hypothetical protein [Caudoviricetes sp.]